jgi:hypothetical protein
MFLPAFYHHKKNPRRKEWSHIYSYRHKRPHHISSVCYLLCNRNLHSSISVLLYLQPRRCRRFPSNSNSCIPDSDRYRPYIHRSRNSYFPYCTSYRCCCSSRRRCSRSSHLSLNSTAYTYRRHYCTHLPCTSSHHCKSHSSTLASVCSSLDTYSSFPSNSNSCIPDPGTCTPHRRHSKNSYFPYRTNYRCCCSSRRRCSRNSYLFLNNTVRKNRRHYCNYLQCIDHHRYRSHSSILPFLCLLPWGYRTSRSNSNSCIPDPGTCTPHRHHSRNSYFPYRTSHRCCCNFRNLAKYHSSYPCRRNRR